jgi:hypothetical protein
MVTLSILGNRALPICLTSLVIILAACGGGQSPISGGTGNAEMTPTVTSVTPAANLANVSIATKTVTTSFAKPMDAATLTTASFKLECPAGTPVAGVVNYTATGNLAALTLPVATVLPENTVCTATVLKTLRDTSGIALEADFAWTFTTGITPDSIAPTITGTIHANGATNVAPNTKVGATFSEAMDPASISATKFLVNEAISGGAVAGTLSYLGVSALFVPTAPLTPATRYIVTIKGGASGVTDLAGNPMATDFVYGWTTGAAADTTAPTVTGTINANGATNVAINTKAGATFSEGMDPLTVTTATFLVKNGTTPVNGTMGYTGLNAVFTPAAMLSPGTLYTITIKGGVGGVKDLAGNAMWADYVYSWTTASALDTTAPSVTTVNPANGATNVPVTSAVNATFSEAMDPLTISTASFTVQGVTGLVSMGADNTIATFVPFSALTNNTTYTATLTTAARDLAGNALAISKVWTFTTEAVVVVIVPPVIALAGAAPFGTFGGGAGMTNTGTLSLVNGDIGTIATATGSITGFHDTAGDIYTETPANIGPVNGKIYTCTNSTTGPTSASPNAPACAIATQARLDAQTAYLALAAKAPLGGSPAPGTNLAGITLLAGVYKAPAGSFMIQGGNLTLDAQGDANATWVFQMSTTLTVGGPGAAFPQSIILAGGAQAKNVFWQVGSFATINAAGGGTMVGTIISQAGASFSTAGNVSIVTLNGRVLSLGASVTLVDTVINVP